MTNTKRKWEITIANPNPGTHRDTNPRERENQRERKHICLQTHPLRSLEHIRGERDSKRRDNWHNTIRGLRGGPARGAAARPRDYPSGRQHPLSPSRDRASRRASTWQRRSGEARKKRARDFFRRKKLARSLDGGKRSEPLASGPTAHRDAQEAPKQDNSNGGNYPTTTNYTLLL